VAQGAVLWCREDGRVEGYESALSWCMRYVPMLHQDLCRSNCRHATANVGEAAVSVQSSMCYAPSTIVTTNREPPSSRANRQSQIENPKSRIPNEQGLSPRGRDTILDYGLWILEAFRNARVCAAVQGGWKNGGMDECASALPHALRPNAAS